MALFITASAGLKASLDGEADDRKAKVEIKFNEVNWIDITAFVESIEIASSLESFSGFATTNTANVALRNPKLADGTRPFSSNHYVVYDPVTYHFNGIKQGDGYGNLRANREIRISATSGAWEYIYVFTGYIDRAGFQEQEEGVIDQVKIGCWDGAKKLIETPCLTAGGDEISYVGYKICDSAAPGASLVHAIALLGGIAAVDVIEDNITGHTCDYVRLTGNVWQELSKIAEAYLAYLYFDGSGKLCFVGSRFADAYVEPNPPTSEWDFDKDNIIRIQKDHTEVVANHVKVQHKAYEIAVNKEIIYKFVDENTWDGEKNAYNIPLGDNVLPWTDPTVNHFLEFATPGGEKIELAYDIDAVGEILVQSTLGNITVAAYTVYANKVKLRLQNLVANDWLEKVEVEGKPIRNTKIFNITEIDAPSIAKYGEKSKEVENKYFSSDVQAQTVCAWQRDLGAHPRQMFKLTVPALLHCQTGAWVKITLTDTGIGGAEDVYCRVDKYVHQFTKKRKAVTEIDLLALIYDWVDSSAATPSLITPNTPENAIVPSILLHPTYVEVQDGYNAGGGTTVPTVPTIMVCQAIGTKGILIAWDRQLNLTNFDRYEIQVSDDDLTWYELRFDGVDWKGALATDTDWGVEWIVHSGIPHIGAVDNPAGRTLHYQVRQVTKAALPSAFSASTSATTKTVAAGDLAIDSVYANNILAAAIQTMLLRAAQMWIGYAGTGTYGSPDEGDRRIYVDDDEILFQIYTAGAWSTERQIALGGVDANGNFRPFLGCRGVLGDITDSPLLDPIPGRGFHLFKFDNNAQDQHGVDPWTITAGAFAYSTTRWEGTHSLYPDHLLAWYAGGWVVGASCTACFMFRDDTTAVQHGILSFNASNLDDRIRLYYSYPRTMRLEIKKGAAVAEEISSAVLSTGTWHFVGMTYNSATNTGYLRVDGNQYSLTPSGTWGSGTKSVYLALPPSPAQRKMDDLLISADTAMDPDLFFQHVQRNVAWTAEYYADDLLLKPKTGGAVMAAGDLEILGRLIGGSLFSIGVSAAANITLSGTARTQHIIYCNNFTVSANTTIYARVIVCEGNFTINAGVTLTVAPLEPMNPENNQSSSRYVSGNFPGGKGAVSATCGGGGAFGGKAGSKGTTGGSGGGSIGASGGRGHSPGVSYHEEGQAASAVTIGGDGGDGYGTSGAAQYGAGGGGAGPCAGGGNGYRSTGGYEADGGDGGGCLFIICKGNFVNNGTITANGEDGEAVPYEPGGGGGGGCVVIVVHGTTCTVGSINCVGGDGGLPGTSAYGGGGGGGHIEIYGHTPSGATLSVAGGDGPGSAQDGATGTTVTVNLDTYPDALLGGYSGSSVAGVILAFCPVPIL